MSVLCISIQATEITEMCFVIETPLEHTVPKCFTAMNPCHSIVTVCLSGRS